MYHARFVDKTGKRHEKYFQTVPEARNWIEEAKYADKHDDVFVAADTTVDEWFNFFREIQYKSMRKWRKNGVTAESSKRENP